MLLCLASLRVFLCLVSICGCKHLDITSSGGSRQCHIELTMGEHRLRQVHTSIWNCLSLCLIDCHGKAEPDKKLLSLELKREHLIMRRAQRNARQEDSLGGMLSQNYFYIYSIFLEPSDHHPCTVAKPISRINIS